MNQLPEDLLRLYNVVLLEASRRVRNRSLFCHPSGNENVRIIVDSISRVLWRQNHKLAKTLISRSPMAAQFLQVNGRQVVNLDPLGFEEFFVATRSSQQAAAIQRLQKSIAQTKSVNVQKQLKGRLSAARRMQSIFWPHNGRLKLAGLRIPNIEGEPSVLADPAAIQGALKDYWAPVYAHKEIDMDAAVKLFNIFRRRNLHKFNFSNLSLPDSDFFEEYIPKLRDSATGKNGIPYSAYKAVVPLSAHIFSVHTKYMFLIHSLLDCKILMNSFFGSLQKVSRQKMILLSTGSLRSCALFLGATLIVRLLLVRLLRFLLLRRWRSLQTFSVVFAGGDNSASMSSTWTVLCEPFMSFFRVPGMFVI